MCPLSDDLKAFLGTFRAQLSKYSKLKKNVSGATLYKAVRCIFHVQYKFLVSLEVYGIIQ
jgi:hypothetical protein